MMARLASTILHRQRGAAAIEAAIMLPLLLVLLAAPLLLGRIFWHYSVVQKAAHDAARYLSTVPVAEMNNAARGSHAAALAHDIAVMETAELSPGGNYPVSVGITCDDGPCDFGVPATVTVLVRVRVYDPYFVGLTSALGGKGGVPLRGKVVMRYVGQ